MRIFIASKNKYLSNDMKIFGTCSIPLMICKICYISMRFIHKRVDVTFNGAKSQHLVFIVVNDVCVAWHKASSKI